MKGLRRSAVGAVCDRAYFVESGKPRAVIDRAYSLTTSHAVPPER